MVQHYHLLTGLHGYMPDGNEAYQTIGDAKSALKAFVVWVSDDDVDDKHRDAIDLADDGMYAEFPIEGTAHPVFGVEYAEVAYCWEPDCLDNED